MEFSQRLSDQMWESWIGADLFGLENCAWCKEKFKERDATFSTITNDRIFCCHQCCDKWEEQFKADHDL